MNGLIPRETRRSSHTPRARPGLLASWINALTARQRAHLFDRLVRADVALAAAIDGYQLIPRVRRVSLLLVQECAAARSLHVAELLTLFPHAPREAILLLEQLAASRAVEREVDDEHRASKG